MPDFAADISLDPEQLARPSGLDKLRVRGGRELNGHVAISGAKNAGLKLMCAALLTDDSLALYNMPNRLGDIRTMGALLRHIGAHVGLRSDGTAVVQAGSAIAPYAPYDLVRRMRAGILTLGPLVARFGRADISLPGGCAIGTRPVDYHLEGLKAMGAEIALEAGYIKARAPNGLKGGHYVFPRPSHTATENLMMAATLAKGETVLGNCAREPEIVDLADCLTAMGAKIEGAGTSRICITGVDHLHGAAHTILPDRIETGTWLCGVGLCGGVITLSNATLAHLNALMGPLEAAGLSVSSNTDDTITARRNGARLQGIDLMTEGYPGFPTDLQAQIMAMLSLAEGASMITETIFENRFMHVPELNRMGANISVQGNSAIVRGVDKLVGANVMATDLRASVALVLAGIAAEGETVIDRIYHLDRGYEGIVEKLQNCGLDVVRV